MSKSLLCMYKAGSCDSEQRSHEATADGNQGGHVYS